MEMRVVARRGEAARAIAKQLGRSRNTVRRYLRDDAACRYGPRQARACRLEDAAGPADTWSNAVHVLTAVKQRNLAQDAKSF